MYIWLHYRIKWPSFLDDLYFAKPNLSFFGKGHCDEKTRIVINNQWNLLFTTTIVTWLCDICLFQLVKSNYV